jgi:type IV pilus assembly protein PilC
MATFVCRVGTADGAVATRTVDASNEENLRAELARQGSHLFSFRRSEETGPRGRVSLLSGAESLGRLVRRRRPVSTEEFLVFNQELVALLKAGLPVVAGFEILLERQENPRFRQILADVREKLVSGVALSDAFLSHGDAFPRLYGTSLKAGERSGEVEKVLRRYLSYQKILASVKRRVVGALVYPAVLVGLSIGLITILMTYVIPRFMEFFAGFGTQLPLVTRIVVTLATFFKANFPFVVAALLAGWWALSRWRRTNAGHRAVDAFLLRLPVVGRILHQFALSQFARSLATLVGAGTPLVPALEISSGAVANRKVSDAVRNVVPKVREGAELWRSLEETGEFTSLSVEMIKVGEATGALEEMLTNVSDFYDESIEASLQRLVNLIEPVILIVMGGVIATLLLSIYLPMFSILSNIRS